MLTHAKESYEQLAAFRRKRNRCRDYTYGRQWNDVIEVNGRRLTEYEYILNEGNVPLKNNLIRRIVRNVLGVFRSRLADILKEEYPGDLAKIAEDNSLAELFSRTMEEFLISGMAVHRKRLMHPAKDSVNIVTEIVSPDSFFFNTDSRDSRGWDLNLVGQFHKVSKNDWIKAFVRNRDDYRKAQELFVQPKRKVTVAEVWKKEVVPFYLVHDLENACVRMLPEAGFPHTQKFHRKKWILREVWKYYFYSEDGRLLREGFSPYRHGSHPYVMKCYPFLDGEIQSFVADMIDQQRYTNRLITLYDWVIRASAKGVLLMPEGSVAPEHIRDVADQWGRFNGVIVYKSDPMRPEPKQVSGNTGNLGISELLEIQLKMMEDVSGVNGILQGNTSGGNVSGTLYDSQTTNALYSLSDLLETYRAFIHACALKDALLSKKYL